MTKVYVGELLDLIDRASILIFVASSMENARALFAALYPTLELDHEGKYVFGKYDQFTVREIPVDVLT